MWIGYAQCIGMRSVDNKRFAHTTIIHQYRRPRTHTIARSSSLSHASTVFRPVQMWFSVHHTVFVCFFFPAKIVTFIHIFFFFPPSLIFTLKWFANESKVHANMLFVPFAYIFDEYFLLRSWKMHVSIQKIYIDNNSQFPCAWDTCKLGGTCV